MASELTATVVHQQGVSKLPLRAGAHSFGRPQTGHWKFGFGNTVNVVGCGQPNETKLTSALRLTLAG
jgi:hypothetical protein